VHQSPALIRDVELQELAPDRAGSGVDLVQPVGIHVCITVAAQVGGREFLHVEAAGQFRDPQRV